MEFLKILLERNIADIIVNIILVWFGLYICPTKPKPIYRAAQKKSQTPEKSVQAEKSTRPKKGSPLLFLFISHYLNTGFEHKGVNTEGCLWRLK